MPEITSKSQVLVTGCCGFIGFWLSRALLDNGYSVVGIDSQKQALFKGLSAERLSILQQAENFQFLDHDLSNSLLATSPEFQEIEYVFHFAARGGVRRSAEFPEEYVRNNIRAHQNILEFCVQIKALKHFFYASSSSVYGDRQSSGDFKESDTLGRSMSFYAMTKCIVENLTAQLSARVNFLSTGLRFFTVYGPLGRPDMACGLFLDAIRNHKPIVLWKGAKLSRDFTFVNDVAAALLALLCSDKPRAKHEIVNIGSSNPRTVQDLVSLLEEEVGQKAEIVFKERPDTELMHTKADISKIQRITDWKPAYSLEDGIRQTCSRNIPLKPI